MGLLQEVLNSDGIDRSNYVVTPAGDEIWVAPSSVEKYGLTVGDKIPVRIFGYIDAVHGRDDGVSQEFSVDVRSVNAGIE